MYETVAARRLPRDNGLRSWQMLYTAIDKESFSSFVSVSIKKYSTVDCLELWDLIRWGLEAGLIVCIAPVLCAHFSVTAKILDIHHYKLEGTVLPSMIHIIQLYPPNFKMCNKHSKIIQYGTVFVMTEFVLFLNLADLGYIFSMLISLVLGQIVCTLYSLSLWLCFVGPPLKRNSGLRYVVDFFTFCNIV